MPKLGNGWLLSVNVEEEKEVRDHRCAVMIVKRPCCCCWLPLIIAILASIIGWVVMLRSNDGKSAGPLRTSDDGVAYPFYDLIAKQMDTLKLANDESEDVYNEYRKTTGRRLFALSEQPDSFRLEGTLLGALLPPLPTRMPADTSPYRLAAPRRALQSSSSAVEYQSEELVSASFIYQSRDTSASVFDDAALDEVCALHHSMTTDTSSSGDYRGYADFCLRRQLRNGSYDCYSGATPLVFFYGDATYDIDTVDLSVFNTRNFEAIASLVIDQGAAAARAQYPTDAPAVIDLFNRTLRYQNHWFDAPIQRPPFTGCQPSQKKDVAKVVSFVALVRNSTAMNSVFGSVINFYFDARFSVNNLKNVYTRGTFDYGGPLKYGSYNNANDRESEQEDAFVDWFWKKAKLQDAYNEGNRKLWNRVLPTGFVPPLLTQILLELLVFDGVRAVAPLVFVFLIVWFQTRSLFIAFATIIECILSFTAAILLMVVINIRWMAFEQFLAIYIVLAIGADDVFVFMDAYKQSFYMGPEVNASLTKRMSWVYRRAGTAMLITSLTTCCAFIATAIASPIPSLQNFGIFAAAVIALDYVLVMTFLCACVVVYHNLFENKPALCCACCTCAKPKSALDWWLCQPSKHGGCSALCGKMEQTTTQVAFAGGPETVPSAKPLYVRLFEDTFPFDLVVKTKWTRALSIIVFLALMIPAIIGTSQLEAQTSAEQFLPESHPFQRFFTAQTYFASSREDETIEMQIVYGFDPKDPVDLNGVNRLFNPDDLGTPKYRSDFVMDAAAQTALIADCQQLHDSSLLKVVFNPATQTTEQQSFCWIEAFRNYRLCRNESFPVAGDASAAILQWVLFGTNSQCPEQAWPWGRSGTSETPGSRYDFTADLGWLNSGSTLKLAWTRIRADSKLIRRAYLPASSLRVRYDDWEALSTSLSSDNPTSLGSSMQIASSKTSTRDNKWLHMLLQETYVNMALTGVAVGLAIALLVLLFATKNLIVAFLSIFTIACALCCVFGLIVARGWELGSAESLAMMTLTGFAVDYVVHLSHSYMESLHGSPVDRVHDALRSLGISVFWGMLTSLVAAFVLSTLQLQFFSKFGVFFLYTIVCSYLWSVLFLMPMLAFIGPHGVGPHAKKSSTISSSSAEMQAA